ncbi:MAG: hypothetical protein ACK4RV_11605 [Caulobacter sp.]
MLLIGADAVAQNRSLDQLVSCDRFAAKADATVRTVASCSNAAFERRDIAEADAICSAAASQISDTMDAFREAKGAAARFADACPDQTGAADRLVLAIQWHIDWLEFRQRNPKGPPKPFSPPRANR